MYWYDRVAHQHLSAVWPHCRCRFLSRNSGSGRLTALPRAYRYARRKGAKRLLNPKPHGRNVCTHPCHEALLTNACNSPCRGICSHFLVFAYRLFVPAPFTINSAVLYRIHPDVIATTGFAHTAIFAVVQTELATAIFLVILKL